MVLSIILLVSCQLKAQQYTFKILTLSGNVEYRLLSAQMWTKVKTGESLKNDFEIRLSENSYAVLLFEDGRTIEMMNEGIFNVRELEQNIKYSKTSVTQKFVKFVADEIIVDKSSGKTMKEFAAVVRVKPFHIETAIPTFTSVLEPVTDLSWYSYPSTKAYILSILNPENTTIFMDLVEDTSYTLVADNLKLNRQTIYKWYVVDADNPKIASDTNSITLLSDVNRKSILDTVKIYEAEADRSPLNILSLGAFYERNNLNIEALKQFSRAESLAPESEEYKKLFANFLLKQKLYVRASELLEEK
jgi:hypothetical protein